MKAFSVTALVLAVVLSGCSSDPAPAESDPVLTAVTATETSALAPLPATNQTPDGPGPAQDGFDLATSTWSGDLVLQFRLANHGDGDCNVQVKTASVADEGTGPTMLVVSSWDGSPPGWAIFSQRPEIRVQAGDIMDTDQQFGQGLETTGTVNYTVGGQKTLDMTIAARSLQAWDNPRMGSDVLRWSLHCAGPYVLDHIRAGRQAMLLNAFNGDGAAAAYAYAMAATPAAGLQVKGQLEVQDPVGLVLADASGGLVLLHAEGPGAVQERQHAPEVDPGILVLEGGPGAYRIAVDAAQSDASWWALLAGVTDLAAPQDLMALGLDP